MLSDEEKKEYEAFKYYYQTNTEKGISYIPDYMCENVLNLIEKQSKEIEELKNTETYKIAIIDKYKYISKDKIKAKIEEVQKRLKEETRTNFLIILKILENELQSLLEGESD